MPAILFALPTEPRSLPAILVSESADDQVDQSIIISSSYAGAFQWIEKDMPLVAFSPEVTEANFRWPRICENKLEFLARNATEYLMDQVERGDLADIDATLAVEFLGRTQRPDILTRLLNLRSNPSPLVREGVVYGLAEYEDQTAIEALRQIATTDQNGHVRKAAESQLNLLES